MLNLFLWLLILAAIRLAYVSMRPYRRHKRCGGRGCRRCDYGHIRRFGAGWTARAYLALRRAAQERRERT